jgi:hypothetical protein
MVFERPRASRSEPIVSLTTLRTSETVRNTALAGSLAAVLAWFGPPGTDFAAHVFQLHVFLQHGFALWSNYWYAGRYTFVGYSLIYYPLAALAGIRLLAVLSVAASAAAFSLVVRRTWGETSPWVSRFFALVAAASIVTAAFPYGLGLAFALAALVAIANRRLVWFSLLAVLSFAASPLAFVFLLVVLGAVALARSPRDIGIPAAVLAAICVVGLGLWRLFPDPGHYPFPTSELVAALVFCAVGAGLTWRIDRARVLHILFLAYGAACALSYLVPTNLGGNIVRLRLVAIPIAILVLSLRRWRPLPIAVLAMGLALSWNLTPLAYSFFQTTHDPAAQASYWQPVVRYLHRTLTPDYRVEAVGTADHWEAVYLPQAGIPIVRGWFRQNDFPLNELLYDGVTPHGYLAWLHRLSVRYVVLTDSSPDYSAREEAQLLSSGRSGLPVVFRSLHATVYAVPSPRPIITGPGHPKVAAITESTITLHLSRAGTYQVGIRFTPYLQAHASCVTESKDGMTMLSAPHAGTVRLAFQVSPSGALAALTGSKTTCAES